MKILVFAICCYCAYAQGNTDCSIVSGSTACDVLFRCPTATLPNMSVPTITIPSSCLLNRSTVLVCLPGSPTIVCPTKNKDPCFEASSTALDFGLRGCSVLGTAITFWNVSSVALEDVTMDGGKAMRPLSLNLVASLNIASSVFRNGLTPFTGGFTDSGGCIFLMFVRTVDIRHSTFTNCISINNGGAVTVEKDSASIHFENTTFDSCTAKTSYGGALTIFLTHSNLIVATSVFINCHAPLSDGGGFVATNVSSVSVVDTKFVNCISLNNGGAATISRTINVSFIRVQVKNCTAENFGALYIYAVTETAFIDVINVDNSTAVGFGSVYIESERSVSLTRCLLYHSSSPSMWIRPLDEGTTLSIVDTHYVGCKQTQRSDARCLLISPAATTLLQNVTFTLELNSQTPALSFERPVSTKATYTIMPGVSADGVAVAGPDPIVVNGPYPDNITEVQFVAPRFVASAVMGLAVGLSVEGGYRWTVGSPAMLSTIHGVSAAILTGGSVNITLASALTLELPIPREALTPLPVVPYGPVRIVHPPSSRVRTQITTKVDSAVSIVGIGSAVLAAVDASSFTSLQTFTILSSLSCADDRFRTVSPKGSWMLSPLHRAIGSMAPDVPEWDTASPVLWNVVLIVGLCVLHSLVGLCFARDFIMFPGLTVTAAVLLVQGTMYGATLHWSYEVNIPSFTVITGILVTLGPVCIPLAVDAYWMYWKSASSTRIFRAYVDLPSAWILRLALPRGYWAPEADVDQYGVLFAEYVPGVALRTLPVTISHYCVVGLLAGMRTASKSQCDGVLAILITSLGLYALYHLVVLPKRCVVLNVTAGVSCILNAVVVGVGDDAVSDVIGAVLIVVSLVNGATCVYVAWWERSRISQRCTGGGEQLGTEFTLIGNF